MQNKAVWGAIFVVALTIGLAFLVVNQLKMQFNKSPSLATQTHS